MSAAAVIILRRKRFIRRFREAGATTPERAIPFGEVGMRRSWIFNQMLSRGVFLEAGPDRYYMDERAADGFLLAQRRWALAALGVFLAILAVAMAGYALFK